MPSAPPARCFQLPAGTDHARELVGGVLIDPVLPRNFDSTPNESRPVTQRKWWRLPFIVTDSVAALDAYYAERTDEYAEKCRTEWTANGRPQWLAAYPSGVRYTVRCLDGGAWDRSTNWGSFPSLPAAIEVAKSGPKY